MADAIVFGQFGSFQALFEDWAGHPFARDIVYALSYHHPVKSMIASIRENHSITVIGILQIFLIVIGWAATCIHLKFMGYPDYADLTLRWSPLSLFVRNWVAVFFIVPVVWVGQALWMVERSEFSEPRLLNLVSGLAVIAILFLILWDAASDVSYRAVLFSF